MTLNQIAALLLVTPFVYLVVWAFAGVYLPDKKRGWLDDSRHQNKLGWRFWQAVVDDWVVDPLKWLVGWD